MKALPLTWRLPQREKGFTSILLTVLLSALTACHPRSPTANSSTSSSSIHTSDTPSSCKTINHIWGETELCKPPQQIIALDPHEV